MRSRSALRAYSIDEIGARSSSPARSFAFSSVGTPATSSTSASSRWKTGAMFTYEMRPRRIIALALPLHDGVRQRLELLAVQLAVHVHPRSPGVVGAHRARPLQGSAGRNPRQPAA